MSDNHDKIASFLTELSNAVLHAIKKGSAEDRKRLIGALEQMSAGMPSMTVEDANAKEFLMALISLLVGEPTPADSLVEPYSGIYVQILEAVFAHEGHHDHHHHHDHVYPYPEDEEKDLQLKEFLTQIAASVVMVAKKGTDEDKKGLADKLREVTNALAVDDAGPKALLAGFVSILEGKPVDPARMPGGYEGIYRKVLHESVH